MCHSRIQPKQDTHVTYRGEIPAMGVTYGAAIGDTHAPLRKQSEDIRVER